MDEYIRLDTTAIGIDNLIAKASNVEEANALFKAKDVIYSQQRYLTYSQPEPPDHINDLCRQIADHYGFDDQSRILQEECAELIQAVSKVHRCKSDNERYYTKILSMAEEMADVIIMITQLRMLDSKVDESVNMLIDMKLRRQLKRIEEEDK